MRVVKMEIVKKFNQLNLGPIVNKPQSKPTGKRKGLKIMILFMLKLYHILNQKSRCGFSLIMVMIRSGFVIPMATISICAARVGKSIGNTRCESNNQEQNKQYFFHVLSPFLFNPLGIKTKTKRMIEVIKSNHCQVSLSKRIGIIGLNRKAIMPSIQAQTFRSCSAVL
jgi:hypothetical protein